MTDGDILRALDHDIRNREQTLLMLRDWYDQYRANPDNEAVREKIVSFLEFVSVLNASGLV